MALVPVRIRLVTQFQNALNQASSGFSSSLEPFCAWAGSIAVRFRTLAHNQLQVRSAGETPHTVRGSETGAQAQPEGGFVRIARAILPLPEGGLLPRTLFNSVATLRERRTNPVVTDRRYNERRKHERQFYISHHRNGDAGPLRAAENR